MGDAISSLLFQPPPPTRLKESKVIWLTNSFGKRIPAFFIECPKDRNGEGIRAPLPGESGGGRGGGGGGEAASYYSKESGSLHHTLAGSRTTNNTTQTPPPSSYNNSNNKGGGDPSMPPTTPQIRTSKELEMSYLNGHRSSNGGGGGGSGYTGFTPGAPTILYSHANAEDLGNIYPWCKFLSKMLGVNIFAYDYTGYGLATDQGEFW